MALSGSYDFTISANDAIRDAVEDAGILAVGQEVPQEMITKGLRKTNLILKQWIGMPNFMVWKRSTASLTLTAKISFSLKPSGGDLAIQIPEKILVATLKQSANSEIPMHPMTYEEYHTIPNKQDTGTPLKYYYEQQLDQGLLYLDRIPSDTTDTIELVYRNRINDMDAVGDTFDLPQYWYKAFTDRLTIEMCKAYSFPATQDMYAAAQESYQLAVGHDPETEISYFEPGREIQNGRGRRIEVS